MKKRLPRLDMSDFEKDGNTLAYAPGPDHVNDPFYEVFVQICFPKDDKHDRCIMYENDDAKKYSKKKNKKKLEMLEAMDDIYSSEESDPETSMAGRQDWAWDPN